MPATEKSFIIILSITKLLKFKEINKLMLKILNLLLLILVSVATVWAVVPLQQQSLPNGVALITIEELKTKMDKKENVLVLDVRGHAGSLIKGAIRIPLAEIEKNLDKLPKDKLIVTVCSCSNEGSSGRAARILMDKGYTKVAALKGGQLAWEASKYPIDIVPVE